ncbi:MAG: two-component regulator propeller domain-containing protein [Caldilineaceae bacterium]
MQSAPFRIISATITMLLLVALVAVIGLAIRDNSAIALVAQTPTAARAQLAVDTVESTTTPAAPQETITQTAAPALAAQSVLTGALALPDAVTGAVQSETTATVGATPAKAVALSLIALGPVERVTAGGFSFQPLPDFGVEVTGSAVNMQAADADPAIGPVFLLSGGPPGQFVSGSTSSLEAIFAQFVDFFAARDNFRVDNQRAHTATNLRGLAADITNAGEAQGEPFAGQIFMARPGANQIFVMVGIAPADRWLAHVAAEYEAVLNSVHTFVPGTEEAAAEAAALHTPTRTAAVTPTTAPTRFALASGATAATPTPAANALRTFTPTPTSTPTSTLTSTPTSVPISTPQWQVLSNGNYVNAIAPNEQTIWAASDGGVVLWDLQNGAASKFTTVDGLSNNVISAVQYCPIATLGMVFGSEAGLQVFDLRSSSWRTLDSANSPMSFDNVQALYCDAVAGFLVVGYAGQGLDIFDANVAEWTYIGLDEIGPIHALTAVEGLAEIWVGGDAGVALVENGDVTLYSSQNSPLLDAPVTALTASTDGSIWLTAANLLFRVANVGGQREWQQFDAESVAEPAFPDGMLAGVAAAADGTIWVASADVQICEFDPQTERCIRDAAYNPRQQNGLVAGPLTGLAVFVDDSGEEVYYTTAGNGFSRFAEDRWRGFALDDEPLLGDQIRHMVQAESGIIWVTSSGGVQQIDPAVLVNRGDNGVGADVSSVQRFAQVNSELFSDDIRVLLPDGKGGVWFGADGAGYYDGATWSSYSTVDGLVGGSIQAMTIDKAQRVWFGAAEGLSIFNGDAFFSLTEEQGLPSNQVTALLTDRSSPGNIVWIGTDGGGLLRFDKNQIQVYNRNNASLPSNTIIALAQDVDGSLLVGTDRGLARFINERATTIRPLGAAAITAIAVGQNGAAWVGTADSGVYHFNGLAWEQFTSQDQLPSQQVTSILVDQDGIVWIGCANGGLVRYLNE